jgi:hypothetical protein
LGLGLGLELGLGFRVRIRVRVRVRVRKVHTMRWGKMRSKEVVEYHEQVLRWAQTFCPPEHIERVTPRSK